MGKNCYRENFGKKEWEQAKVISESVRMPLRFVSREQNSKLKIFLLLWDETLLLSLVNRVP